MEIKRGQVWANIWDKSVVLLEDLENTLGTL